MLSNYDKIKQYQELIGTREIQLVQLPADELARRIASLELRMLVTELGRDDERSNSYQFISDDESLANVLDFIRYHEVRKEVVRRVDRDFYPDDDRARQQLIETVTHLVIEITGTENS